jgi:hypothetical protein
VWVRANPGQPCRFTEAAAGPELIDEDDGSV